MNTKFLLIKKSFVAILILSFVLGFTKSTKADALGIELSYQCTSTPGVYKVTAKLYRECSGIAFCSGCNNAIPNGNTNGCSAPLNTSIKGITPSYLGVNYGSFILYATGGNNGYDIVQTCSSINSVCTNCNTRSAGTYATGIEVYSYESTVNLSAIPTACCKVSINIDVCCISGIVTTHSTVGLFVTADIDRCLTSCNSAPVFTNDAQALVCNGIDFVYNLGAIDIDGDSLSYAFGSAMQTSSGFNSIVPYITPYSSTYPFPFLGSPNMNAAYPAGLRIDPINGDILFRPNANFATRFVLDVTQWRLVSGVRINVGVTRREVVLISQTCSFNKIPILKTYRNGVSQTGNQNFVAYAGQQFCLDLVAQDQALSSTDQSTADTTDLKWNNPGLVNNYMSNATFTRNYILANRATSGPKADSFKFCWTPPLSAVSSLPHLFTVSGSDRNCPLRAVFTRGINITVETPKMEINETTKKVFCNNKTTIFNVNYSANGVNLLSNNVFTIQLSDSFGSFNNAITIGTATNSISSGTILATLPSGLALNKTYKLRLLSSSNNTVETASYDLTLIQGYSLPIITSNVDTICDGLNATISINPTANITNYKWLLNNQVLTDAASNNILANTNGIYKVLVSNAGCSDTSNAKTIVVNAKPIANFTAPNSFCFSVNNNTISLVNTSTIETGSLNYNWLFSDGSNSNLLSPTKTINSANNLTVKLIAVSNHNCSDSILKTIFISQKPNSNFTSNTYSQCRNNNIFTFVHDSIAGNNYSWDFGDSTFASNAAPIKNYLNTGTFSVSLIEQNPSGCSDTTIKTVNVYPNPLASFQYMAAREQCLKNNQFVFSNNSTIENGTMTYKWVMGENDTIRQLNAAKSFSKKGRYDIYLYCTSNHNCTSFWRNDVTVYDPKIDTIIGNKNPTISSIPYTYSVSTQPSVLFDWTITNGVILSGQGTNSVNVIWSSTGTGLLKARMNEAYTCYDSTYLTVNITNVGINNLSLDNDLKVYPNPTKSSITISNKNNLIGKNYIFTNLVGQTLLTGKLNLGDTIVNLETLQSGMYFLSLDGMSKQSIKVIKE